MTHHSRFLNRRMRFRAALLAGVAALGTLLAVSPASAETAGGEVGAAYSTNWCGHDDIVTIGDWTYHFKDHWTEAGGRHFHSYYARHNPSGYEESPFIRC